MAVGRILLPPALFASSLLHCLPAVRAEEGGQGLVHRPRWAPARRSGGLRVEDLHREYRNIFQHGNRNAASHLWSSFVLDRADQLSTADLVKLFTGFCAVSGSPVRPVDYNRYGLRLRRVPPRGNATVSDERVFGYMHYCCWPCVCDTQDFIWVDTKTVVTRDSGPGGRQFHFAVLGNPCDHEEKLDDFFEQPFERYYSDRRTTLRREAPEVRCEPRRRPEKRAESRAELERPLEGGGDEGVPASETCGACCGRGAGDKSLIGATLSDNGYIIIAMFFDAEPIPSGGDSAIAIYSRKLQEQHLQPGQVSKHPETGTLFQDERAFGGMCTQRANAGYNSGMGEIFRKVAAISDIAKHLPGEGGAGGSKDCQAEALSL